MIVHIADYEDLKKVAVNIPPETDALAAHFWPGPLTMIFEKSESVPYGTTGGLDTVAVRMPSDPIAAALIRAAGGFVSAPSAIHPDVRVRQQQSMCGWIWKVRLI